MSTGAESPEPTTPVRILLCDDHVVVRAGLRALLSSTDGIEVVGEAGSGEEALAVAARVRSDVVLMDLQLGDGMDGVTATRHLGAGRGPGPGPTAEPAPRLVGAGAGNTPATGTRTRKPRHRPCALHQRGDGEDPSGSYLRQVGGRHPLGGGGTGEGAAPAVLRAAVVTAAVLKGAVLKAVVRRSRFGTQRSTVHAASAGGPPVARTWRTIRSASSRGTVSSSGYSSLCPFARTNPSLQPSAPGRWRARPGLPHRSGASPSRARHWSRRRAADRTTRPATTRTSRARPCAGVPRSRRREPREGPRPRIRPRASARPRTPTTRPRSRPRPRPRSSPGPGTRRPVPAPPSMSSSAPRSNDASKTASPSASRATADIRSTSRRSAGGSSVADWPYRPAAARAPAKPSSASATALGSPRATTPRRRPTSTSTRWVSPTC
ncbi:Response regulator protein VraR [Streptomyces sp. S4.7]|nr:Response regulator protein VraR [Streptomyces sp. S4.7]